AMLDGYPATRADQRAYSADDPWVLAALLDSLGYPCQHDPITFEEFVEQVRASQGVLSTMDPTRLAALARVFADSLRLRATAEPDEFDGDLLFFRATEGRSPDAPEPDAWRPYLDGAIHVHDIDAAHGALTQPGPIDHIGAVIARHIGSPKEISS
ncbi:MAG TPA: non-ribosomal peptide synthetase, partial [Pseudonocardiaceae bacterium]